MSVWRGDLRNSVRRNAQSAQAKSHRALANLVASAIPGGPLLFRVGPHHALNGARLAVRVDVVEHFLGHAEVKLLDERLKRFGVCGFDQLGGVEQM